MPMYKTGFRETNKKTTRGPPGIGFKLTVEGNYDMQYRTLDNVKMPEKADSAATKQYVDNIFNTDVDLKGNKINNLEHVGAIAVNSEFAAKTYLKASDHGKNISEPTNATDAVTKNYADSTFVTKTQYGKNIPKPASATDAVNLDYISSNCLSKSQHGKNLPDPTRDTDAVNKAFADKTYLNKKQAFNYDCRGRRLQNVGVAEDDLDAVNMQQLYQIMNEHLKDSGIITAEDINQKMDDYVEKSGIVTAKNINQHAPAQKILVEMLDEQRIRFPVIETELKRVADIAERCSKTMGIVVDKKDSSIYIDNVVQANKSLPH